MQLDGYRNYLVSKRIIAEKQIPFYAGWVDQANEVIAFYGQSRKRWHRKALASPS